MKINEKVFGDNPKDMTPVKQDYSPGLGDRADAVYYTISFGWLGQSTGLNVTTTYEQALEIVRKASNLVNGAHIITDVIGQDKLRWGTAPYLIEDYTCPLGDGTPGSGYAKFRRFMADALKYNTDISQIVEPLLSGKNRDSCATGDEVIPESCYTHTEDGNRKIGWTAGDEEWELLSLYNLYDSGYAQRAWQRNIENWNLHGHIYYDALFPVPEGHYNNPNLTTKYGGKITDTEMEWEAVIREVRYSWENFAIASAHEYLYPRYKGISVCFSLPYEPVSDEEYLNFWGNSVVITTRRDPVKNLVWGSHGSSSGDDESFQFNGQRQHWKEFICRMMEHSLQYLYMLERKPLSVINNEEKYEVKFSGNLVSSYDVATENYTLIENGNFVIADGGKRFIPQVGAGCKIYAYSREGGTHTYTLPETWDGIGRIDRYHLTMESGAVYVDTVDVNNGTVTFRMDKEQPYIVVPCGNSPTPVTLNFNELKDGEKVVTYGKMAFGTEGENAFRVYKASARGGFCTPSIYLDSDADKAITALGVEKGTILHSMKIGNKGGCGRVVLHSSNSLNPDVMMTISETDEVHKFNTNWKYGEKDSVLVKIENNSGVCNVLFDAIIYSEKK